MKDMGRQAAPASGAFPRPAEQPQGKVVARMGKRWMAVVALAMLLALAVGPVGAAEKKKAVKKSSSESSFESFEPAKMPCKQFLADFQGDGELAGVALIWGHGYLCALDPNFPPVLDEMTLGSLVLLYRGICDRQPGMTFLEATREIMRQRGVGLPGPAAPPAPVPPVSPPTMPPAEAPPAKP